MLTHETKLASLHELQTVYDTQDLYDLLEIIDVHDALKEEAYKKNMPKK